jgi:hypothetical protein
MAGQMELSAKADFGDSEHPRGHPKEYIQRWKSVHIGRKIFRTKRGYLGLSCQHIREGDKICILWADVYHLSFENMAARYSVTLEDRKPSQTILWS